LNHLFEREMPESDREDEARSMADGVIRPASAFLVRAVAFLERYKQAGFFEGFYRDKVDPTRGIGSFQDVALLRDLLRGDEGTELPEIPDVASPGEPDAVRLSPKEINALIDRLVRRGTLPEAFRERVREGLSFLQQAWSVHREMAQGDPQFERSLSGKTLTEYINALKKKGSLSRLSGEGAVDRPPLLDSRPSTMHGSPSRVAFAPTRVGAL